MSYTSEKEILVPTIDALLTGIQEFSTRTDARIANGREWRETHLMHLNRLRNELGVIAIELVKLKGTTP